jgi:hypothetical protein
MVVHRNHLTIAHWNWTTELPNQPTAVGSKAKQEKETHADLSAIGQTA